MNPECTAMLGRDDVGSNCVVSVRPQPANHRTSFWLSEIVPGYEPVRADKMASAG
jgi:hypothetical protein